MKVKGRMVKNWKKKLTKEKAGYIKARRRHTSRIIKQTIFYYPDSFAFNKNVHKQRIKKV